MEQSVGSASVAGQLGLEDLGEIERKEEAQLANLSACLIATVNTATTSSQVVSGWSLNATVSPPETMPRSHSATASTFPSACALRSR